MLRWQENSSKTQETDSKPKMWEAAKGRIEFWNFTSEYGCFFFLEISYFLKIHDWVFLKFRNGHRL